MPAPAGSRGLATVLALLLAAPPASAAAPRAVCPGAYADALSAMAPETRARDQAAGERWIHCLRAAAVYEHLAYGRGGRVRRQYFRKVRHGTGFAYATQGGRWYVATNQHVVSFPEVTRGDEIEGVPDGSRKVRESVKIVGSEADPDAPGQVELSTVVEDASLDVAVLASTAPLALAPYRLGRSADLRVGDAVLVRGFPLGAFFAANAGRVIAVDQRDEERGWDHVDFAIDALLNPGNSGSPVLALSCRTGQPEIVGIYHAGYRGAQGLHVVVGIDEVRPVLMGLRPALRRDPPPDAPADPAALRAELARGGPAVMPFGGRAVRVSARGAEVRFALLDEGFPLSGRVELELVERDGAASAVLLPAALGSAEVRWAALAPPTAERAGALRQALWSQLAAVMRYRRAEAGLAVDPARVLADVSARLRDRQDEQSDLLSGVEADADLIVQASTNSETRTAVADPSRGESRARGGASEPGR